MLQAVEEARVGRVRVAGFSVSLDGFGNRPGTESSGSSGKARDGAASLVRRDEDVQDHVWRGRWLGGAWTRPLPTARWTASAFILGRNMFGPGARGMAGRQLEGLVGRQSALSRPDICSDAPRPQADRNGGRHPVRHFVTDGIHAALERCYATPREHVTSRSEVAFRPGPPIPAGPA